MFITREDRVWPLDLLRGVLIAVMTLGHVIYFLHDGSAPELNAVEWIANLVSFTGFVFVSGAVAYITISKSKELGANLWNRILRYFGYLLGYYLLAVWVVWAMEYGEIINLDLTTFGNDVLLILSFQKLAPFTEFLVPLIIFGLLKFPLGRVYRLLSRSLAVSALVGIILYSLGTVWYGVELVGFPAGWKAILVGQEGWFSFPLLQYFGVYLTGIWLGGFLDRAPAPLFPTTPRKILALAKIFLDFAQSRKNFPSISFNSTTKIALSSLGLVLSIWLSGWMGGLGIGDVFNRWPPTVGFLLLGLGLVLLMLEGIRKLHDFQHFPWTRTLLLLLGQNTYAIFVLHTFILYGTLVFSNFRFESLWLIGSIWIITLALAVYLAKILPLNLSFDLTLINWCSCKLSEKCEHADEHDLVVKMKTILVRIFKISELFSVNYRGKKIRLFKKRSVVFGVLLALTAVTTLGVADNYQSVSNDISNLRGQVDREWILTTNDDRGLRFEIRIPNEIVPQSLKVKLADKDGLLNYDFSARPVADTTWQANIPSLDLEPGVYKIWAVLEFYGFEFPTETILFNVSEPLYVTWTIDWEGYDVYDGYLDALSDIAAEYGVVMTQMWNPRVYVTAYYGSGLDIGATSRTQPEGGIFNESTELRDVTSVERAQYLTDWIKFRRDRWQEEIGLHLHMFPDVARDAGVEAREEPVWGGGFTPGYDVLTTAYTREEMVKILTRAKGWFVSQDLGVPKSYRAGAWFADLNTLRALEDTDFLIDSSGRTAYSFGTNRIPGPWNLEIGSQPYFPSTENLNSDQPPPNLRVMEIPNNGADSYAFTSNEMIARFEANWDGGPLIEPRQVTFLSHPHWFHEGRQTAMREVFEYVNQFKYLESSSGPVVYATLWEVYEAFRKR